LVTSDTVDLNASSGIGNTTGITLSSSNITADTTIGDVEIANNLGTAVSVSSLTTGTGSVSFNQSGGGNITFVGPVSSGGAVNGGNITLTASDGLVVGGTVSSALGTGGNLLVSGATLSGAVTVGAGDVSIQGGLVDLVVDAAIVAGGDITLAALRDVIVNAVVDADNGGNIIVSADTNSAIDPGTGVGGHGGVRVTTAGQLDAEGEVTATGSDLFATTGQVDSVLIDADGAAAQVLAIGNITLADGSNAPVNASTVINGVVQSSGAAATITLSSEKDIVIGVLGDIMSVDGTITNTADTAAGLNGGVVLMADGGSVSSGTGQIVIAADGNITLGTLSTGSTSDSAVELTTTSGAIVDGGDAGTDVNANSGGLIIRSDAGVGVGNAIETSVATVDVENFATGAIHLSEADDVFIKELSQLGGGEILFDSDAGTVEVLTSGAGVTGSENVRLAALGQDMIINADVISGTGNITLDAGNDLDVNAAVTSGGSGTIYLTSVSNTTIDSQLTSATGDILVESGGDITQTASITSTSGDVGLIAGSTLAQTSNGDITTGGDVLVSAGADWTMAGDAVITAVGNVVGEALGGDIGLGVINGVNVALSASNSILDSNAGLMNITATNLSLVATNGLIGGSDTG
ncbi:MAG: S-layer family protein, partial [Planctomycetaceae bacterium]|nr:S-layer family protein [Planctomycetaceae bacterium]